MTGGGDHAAAREQLGLSFKSAMAAVRRLRGRETHHPGELSYAQYALMFALEEHGELSARELAGAAALSPATVTQMLESLAHAGLVGRVRSEEDRRVVLTSLTAAGSKLLIERRAQIEPRWAAALSQFTDRELRTTARVLDRLRDLFEEFAAAPAVARAPAVRELPTDRHAA